MDHCWGSIVPVRVSFGHLLSPKKWKTLTTHRFENTTLKASQHTATSTRRLQRKRTTRTDEREIEPTIPDVSQQHTRRGQYTATTLHIVLNKETNQAFGMSTLKDADYIMSSGDNDKVVSIT